jgi:hypothetical protein
LICLSGMVGDRCLGVTGMGDELTCVVFFLLRWLLERVGREVRF